MCFNPYLGEHDIICRIALGGLIPYTYQSYLIGLWFSLRTHASQIWQNPQQLMQPLDAFGTNLNNPAGRMSLYNKLVNTQFSQTLPTHRLDRKESTATMTGSVAGGNTHDVPASHAGNHRATPPSQSPSGAATPYAQDIAPPSPLATRKVAYAPPPQPQRYGTLQAGPSQLRLPLASGYTPILDSVNMAVRDTGLQPMHLPPNLTADDFTRAVAVATVSALRHQQEPQKHRGGHDGGHDEAAAGHDAPSWSRTMSASVLLSCTLLYAIIAG